MLFLNFKLMEIINGSRDGEGAGDCDKPYKYFKPKLEQPFPFNTRQYSKLLILKSDVTNARLVGMDRLPKQK